MEPDKLEIISRHYIMQMPNDVLSLELLPWQQNRIVSIYH